MERILTELVERLQKAHRDRLVSVILYGSGAMPQGKDRLSDFNILCVLTDVTLDDLGASEPVFRWWREMGNPAPLLLSRAEIETASDCFPIEFHDIRERHRILLGSDVVERMEVDDSFYRAQVEHQLRAKLLRLRQKAGAVLSESDLLTRLMADSISTFCVLFRHALILAGEPSLFEKRAVIAAAASKFGFEASSFGRLLDLREGKIKPKDIQARSLFAEYLTQIQTVVDAVDNIAK